MHHNDQVNLFIVGFIALFMAVALLFVWLFQPSEAELRAKKEAARVQRHESFNEAGRSVREFFRGTAGKPVEK